MSSAISLYIIEQILSTFNGSSRQVKPQSPFGMKFIPFAILTFTLCTCLGELGRYIPLAKLIRSKNAFERRIIIFIFMIIIHVTHVRNSAFVNKFVDLHFGCPLVSNLVLQFIGFIVCVVYGCLCGATYIIEKSK
jgi:Na+/alanine symporter